MNNIQFTQEEMERLEKVTPKTNTNGYGEYTEPALTADSNKRCVSRLPCGVCLLTNKVCPLLVEEGRVVVGDPPYPYTPFTWCSTGTKDNEDSNSVLTAVNNEN